ncbi:B12-binding domain-containing radical SAM protein [Thermodesulfobacteriota bacterium]
MKIALVIPMNNSDSKKGFYDYEFYSTFLKSRRYVSYLLAIPTLVALTPQHHEIRIFDENIEDIDYTWEAEIVGISVRTMFAQRAYEIAEAYKSKGTITVLGGIHPSMCSEEALQHCDSVVIGEAESVWGTLLQDAENGCLKRLYKTEQSADLQVAPMPIRASLSKERYFFEVVQTTKGCPFRCEFCSVYAFDGRKIRSKTIPQVLEELRDIKNSGVKYKTKHSIFFVDDNIIADKAFALKLFRAIKSYDINWMCQASINISKENELLKLMKDSGCGAIFIGFESLSKENLDGMHKGINQRYNYFEAIQKIQSHGILVHSSFIVGNDLDTHKTFDDLIDFIQESNLLMPLINILTPFPGTELFARLEKNRRILHKNWTKYDTKHVVFHPLKMSPKELLVNYKRIIQTVYSFDSIIKKLNYYWEVDFWKRSNELDPVKFKYRLLFAFRLITLLFSRNMPRSKFILKMLPHVFNKRVRVSTILSLMAYNDFAYSL